MKFIMKFNFVALFAFSLLLLSSCEKDQNELTVSNYVDATVDNLQSKAGCGAGACFELVFPLDIVFSDGTEVETNSLEDLKSAVKTWYENNPGEKAKPDFVYPIDILKEDGTLVTINNFEELKTLKAQCPKKPKNGKHYKKCFELVFPISLDFPDGTTTEFDSGKEMKKALYKYKKDNPEATDFPSLAFPIEVEITKTEEIVSIASLEELVELKDSCE